MKVCIRKQYQKVILIVYSTESNPGDLQMRIFMDIMVHFGLRGREGLRELRRDRFQIKVDGNGKRYACHIEV